MPNRREDARGFSGIALVLIGVAVLGANIHYDAHVVVSITSSHGLHESDIAGAALVCLGAALIWFRR